MSDNDRLCVRGLNPEVIDTFKKIVISKHGKLYSTLSKEIEKAMILYIELSRGEIRVENAHAHAPVEHAQDEPPAREVPVKPVSSPHPAPAPTPYIGRINDIIIRLKAASNWDVCDYPRSQVIQTIKQVAGQDKRTIEKYDGLVLEIWRAEHVAPTVPIKSNHVVESEPKCTPVETAISNLKSSGRWDKDQFPGGDVIQAIQNINGFNFSANAKYYSEIESIWKRDHRRPF